jgi:predicted branched-subunit amino acid permease
MSAVTSGSVRRRAVAKERSRPGGVLDRDALRDITPVVISVVPFAAIVGVTIAQSQVVPPWAGLLAGPAIYGGSSQLAALTLLESGTGVATILASVAIINARLSMYGAVMEPHFRAQPAWFRWLAPHFLVDQTYAIATARTDLDDPARFRRYWATAGIVLGIGWTVAMGLAVLLGPVIPVDSPLTFASTAVFVGLLFPRLRERVARRPAVIAGVVALLASPLPHGLGLLAGALAGVAPSLLRPRRPA